MKHTYKTIKLDKLIESKQYIYPFMYNDDPITLGYKNNKSCCAILYGDHEQIIQYQINNNLASCYIFKDNEWIKVVL